MWSYAILGDAMAFEQDGKSPYKHLEHSSCIVGTRSPLKGEAGCQARTSSSGSDLGRSWAFQWETRESEMARSVTRILTIDSAG